jgi:acyl-homoserine-lactone acylase
VLNANDSYWLSDPARPAAAVSPLYGATASPRSVRTRMNMELLRPDSPLGYAGEDGPFSIAEAQAALFGNDSLTANLLLPELLAACRESPERDVDGASVNLTDACEVLEAWDRKLNLDSRGAVLFREWLTRYPYNETYLGRELFAEPFDPEQPRSTPRGLADTGIALDKLAEAVLLLQGAGIALDAPLGEHQIGHRMTEKYAVHGGNRHEGIANLQMSTRRDDNPTDTPIFTGSDEFVGDSESLSKSGYNVVHGSSFIMTLAFTEEGPQAEAILSYSQSGDPGSAHFSDQTVLYRDKRWRKILFKPEEIAREAVTVDVVRSTAPGAD